MKASGLTLENFFLFAHVFLIDLFIVIFFPVDNEHLHNSFLSLFAFTISFTFSEIMKAHVLVEHLSTTSF